MLKNQTFVDPIVAQKIKNLQDQMQKLIKAKLQIQNNYKLKPQTKQHLLKYNQQHRIELRKVLEKCKFSMVDYFDKQVNVVSKECIENGVVVQRNVNEVRLGSLKENGRDCSVTNRYYNHNLNSISGQRASIVTQSMSENQNPNQNNQQLKYKAYSIRSKVSESTNNRSTYMKSNDLNSSSQNCNQSKRSPRSTNYLNNTKMNSSVMNDSLIQVGKSCRILIRSKSKQYQRSGNKSRSKDSHQRNFNSQAIRNNSNQRQSLISKQQNYSDIIEINQFNVTNKLEALKQCNTSYDDIPYKGISSILIQNQLKNSQNKSQQYLLKLKKQKLSQLLKKQTSRQIVSTNNQNSQHYQNQEDKQQQQHSQQTLQLISLYKYKIQCLQKKCQSLQESNNLFFQTIRHQQQAINNQQNQLYAQSQIIKSQQVKLAGQEKIIQELRMKLEVKEGNINKNKQKLVQKNNNKNANISKYTKSTHEKNIKKSILIQQYPQQQEQKCKQSIINQLNNMNQSNLLQNHQNQSETSFIQKNSLNSSSISKQEQTIKLIKTIQELMGELRKIREENQSLKGQRKLLLKKIQF